MTAFVLVHSPLVGSLTWVSVGNELRERGHLAVIPALASPPGLTTPYWRRHAEQVAEATASLSVDEPLMLVGHSGAGMLLPAIRQALGRPVSAYLFVDAGIPRDGTSRLDLFSDPEEGEQFRMAAVDGLLPAWTEENLRQAIPDNETRRRFVAELRPLPLAVYEEPIPVFEGWPDAPCAYLHFTRTDPRAYEEAARLARQWGWAYTELDGGHFHMLVDPASVAEALTSLLA
jgi:pimeloyl-ACP methyl ester carboxylesterase